MQSDTQFVILTKSRRDPQKPKEIEMRMTREFYTAGLPEEARLIEQEGGIAYHYEKGSTPHGMYFRGKAQKPTKHYSFRTEEQREAFCEKFFEPKL